MVIAPHTTSNVLAMCKLGEGGNFAKLAAFPGFTKWQDRNLIVRATGANIQYILTHWPDAEWIGGTEVIRAEHSAQQIAAAKTAVAKNDATFDTRVKDYKFRRPPMAHQAKAFLLSRGVPAFGLFMEQGTGKTKVIIDTACWLWQQGKIDAVIIVAWPNGVHQNWVEYELPQDMTVPYEAESWGSNHNTKYRRLAWRKLMIRKGILKVATFNVECFTSEPARDMLLEILDNNRCLFVIDQSASIKNPSAKRTKFLIKCSTMAPYRRVMDGAPVAEGADELYSQFKFLDPAIIGHDTWTAFQAEFCEMNWFGGIAGYKNLPELRRRIDGYCYRVLAKDCQDLPERVYKLWPFDLGDEEQRIFDELKKKDLSFFAKDVDALAEDFDFDAHPHIEEHHALVKNLRLQQISSGWWPAEERKMINEDGPGRLAALLLLLKKAKGKALIFARFRSDLELLQQTLGDKAVSYHGGIKDTQRALAKRRFMEDDKILYFLGQPRSAGIGHTLTAAHHVIFYANDDSLRLREECEKRAHRQGLKHTLIVWDICARGSHDTKIINALRNKKELANEILQDPQSFFLVHK